MNYPGTQIPRTMYFYPDTDSWFQHRGSLRSVWPFMEFGKHESRRSIHITLFFFLPKETGRKTDLRNLFRHLYWSLVPL